LTSPPRAERMSAVPDALRFEPRWLVWRMSADGKKLPFSPLVPRGPAVDSTEPANWSTYDEAVRVARESGADGVGFALGGGLGGVDLDDCVVDGELTPAARAIVAELDSYTELSPSGTGVKIFVKAPEYAAQKRAGLEIYCIGRYFTVTGNHLPGTPTTVEDRGAALSALLEREFYGPMPTRPAFTPAPPIEMANGARNNDLASLAGSMRRRGASDYAILAALRAENARCSDPLPEREVEAVAKSISRYKVVADDFKKTDKGNAEFFAAYFADRVRFDHRVQRWLVFTDHRWTPDTDGALMRSAMEAADARLWIATEGKEPDRADRIKHALRSQSRGGLEAALALAKNIKPISDPGDDWDTDPWLLGVPNGVVDLRTGELRDGRPEDRITMSTRAGYDPAAACPLWLETLRQIFPGRPEVVEHLRRALGYSLTGDMREECFWVLWGERGRNGKGTIVNTVAKVLGDYWHNLATSALELHRHGASGTGGAATPDIVGLPGKRFVTASEPARRVALNEARIKGITGRDPFNVRPLYKPEFTFEPVAKIWLSTNLLPLSEDESDAFWARLNCIEFRESFADREDKTLKDRLLTEGPGILAWLVRGAVDWRAGGLARPDAVRDATAAYRRENDQITAFLETCAETGAGMKTRASELYAAYARWARSERRDPISLRAFGPKMRERFEAEETKGRVWYLGVGLRASEPI
jgi:putative DNA primase/helicase